MSQAKKPTVYAFIDSQNLNLGVQSLGWKLDYAKFRLYLKNKYNVSKAYLFIGQVVGNETLYDNLQNMGYHLIFKPTTQYKVDGKLVTKGNVDAELVLYAAARKFQEYDQALVITGDGDFACLVEYLLEKGKLLHVIVPNDRYSKLLARFTKNIVRVSQLQNKLEYKKTRSSGRSKP